ncbi:response regulator [Neptunomonas phycophila]|jgi:DNA-binding response OmpR family regulator|uniref:response regulator n=1 Tax=Neptunomonas TaxID=75687 RepID=UPI000948FDF9|nr:MULTISPECIES: response regulator [Neptunomonas]MBT3145835.1 response regulator [Neptunomonas phycophila]MDN2659023.1 response regulator [Neptunomonas sp. CHC150]MDO6469659.1 response regulator [Neptunomonas phycophila]MDO6784617.1 response regulator [Neptunomonas phycophila]QLE96248.1 response regulator [Neptunomonas phycophila]
MKCLNVLVVDDAKFICEHVTKIVHESFPSSVVKSAFNGEDAQQIMSSITFDLILCDWEMPHMNGLELLKWTRQQDAYKTTPYVMITSRGEREYVLKAIQAGVNDYLGKPFTSEQLIQKINKMLGKKTSVEARMVKDDAKPETGTMTAGSEAQAKHIPKPKGMAHLRVRNDIYKCAIKDLSLKEVFAVVKNEGNYPVVLDQAVIDIESMDGGNVARLNGFIRMVEAAEAHIETPYINILVALVDDDPEKMDHLSRYIAQAR